MKTMNQMYDDIKAKFEECDVTAADVKQGKKFFSTVPEIWGVRTGTGLMQPTPTPTSTPTATPTSSLYGGLISYYKFDESSGSSASESVLGTYNLTTISSPSWVAGKIGNALEFYGTADYAYRADTGLPLGSNARSVSLWVYLNGDASYGQFLAYGTHTNSNFYGSRVGATTTNKLSFMAHGGSYDWDNITTLSPSQWYHVVLKYNGTTLEYFVNGTSAGTASRTLNTVSDGTFSVGAKESNGIYDSFFKGKIDELGIWNRALSPSEISELWNSGSGKALF
ncbi:MAG: LamG domain-containing protein [Candidatus Aureabacteria bacterium]|nr:LamG domain-containing protein [Candidatus Auribacterota bacterium]